MKRKVTPRDVIVYTLCISAIFLILIDSTFKLVGNKYNFWLMAGIVSGAILYVFVIHNIKFAWISIALLFLIPKPLYIIKFFKYFISSLNGFIESVIENQFIVDKYVGYFTSIILIVLLFLILIFYYIVVIKKQVVVLIVFGGAIISTYYFMGLDNLFFNCNIFLIMSFILYSYNNYSIMWSKWDYKNVKIGKGYFLKVIGINIILVLLVNLAIKALPIDREPISLGWFQNNIWNRVEEFQGKEDAELSDSAYKSKFSLSYTGYQQDARRLGGPVTNSYSRALRVGSKDDIGGVHLRGTIKDFYNGFMWDKSDNKTLKFKDKLEVKEYSMGYLLKEMEILHEGVKTTTVFNALYPFQLTNSWKYAFIDSDLEIFNPKTVRSGKGYTIKFKEYNIDQATILDRGADRIGKYDATFNKYLELPSGIPSRVYDLTEEITNKYKSPYMKASAIEDYLRKSFPYSMDTSILPEGRDFVDYFIFDEKKGSCSYYATALAVMTRILDIPSRYVEGFVVPYTQGSDGYREILNSDAHAWVELYLEGVGWVTFDPTPGNTSLAYQFSQESENSSQTPTGNNEGNDNTNVKEDEENQNVENPDELDGTTGNVNAKTPWTQTVSYILIGIFGLGLFLVLASLVAYSLINISIRRNKRIVEFSKHKMILFGKLIRIPYASGETLREYLVVLAGKLRMNLEHYILVYEKALYSKHKINLEEQTEIIDTMLKARKKVMERYGRLRFYYSDYIDTLKFYIRSDKKSK